MEVLHSCIKHTAATLAVALLNSNFPFSEGEGFCLQQGRGEERGSSSKQQGAVEGEEEVEEEVAVVKQTRGSNGRNKRQWPQGSRRRRETSGGRRGGGGSYREQRKKRWQGTHLSQVDIMAEEAVRKVGMVTSDGLVGLQSQCCTVVGSPPPSLLLTDWLLQSWSPDSILVL